MRQQDPRLDRILRHLIHRSFGTLRRRSIAVYWAIQEDLMTYTVEEGRCIIEVSYGLKEAPRRALEGGLAHELCHIEADLRLGSAQRDLAWRRYAESRWCRMREERATEERVIELGYAPHLLALIRFAHRLGHSFSREHGLLYAEIVQRMRRCAPLISSPRARTGRLRPTN